jgi:hypothetical protein
VRYRRARCLGLAVAASLVLSACSELGGGPVSVTTPISHTTPSGAPSTKRPSAPSTAKLRNDLKKGRVTRSFEAGALQVTVEYSLENRVQQWSPGVGQPLEVSMEAIHQRGTGRYSTPTGRKIYLSRVTAYLDVADATGHLDSPEPLTDKADVNPGFFVTTPSSYSQVFVLPPMPDEATKLTIDFRYEMLVLQSQSTTRDFSKQTATDTLVISMP